MKQLLLSALAIFALILCIAQPRNNQQEKGNQIMTAKPASLTASNVKTPDKIWGQLFTDVQLSMALGDNKSFTDAVPKLSPESILKKYKNANLSVKDTLLIKQFVLENFKVPISPTSSPLQVKKASLKEHLEELWPTLVRKSDRVESYSSLLPLPKAYIVPGGRFREIYYWDSYFTMLGLATSNRYDLIENMLDNFKYLIDTYGHIPNGNRSYYLGRSQPPYFALMVQLLHHKKGKRIYKKYWQALQTEYNWWMDGNEKVTIVNPHRRVVKLSDGSTLNRYFDDVKAPRQESYLQDVETAKAYQGKDNMAYTHLRAGAESGWDFSSRWFADTATITTIETTNIIPVDLNCLLYVYENILSEAAMANGLQPTAKVYQHKAAKRKAAILSHCWSNDKQYFFDYNFKNKRLTNRWSLAGIMPLFVKISTNEQAKMVKQIVEQLFIKEGGVVTTPYHTGQQWDAPNGWAPLQYLTVKGLEEYAFHATAKTIADKWMAVNETVYANTGKMLEKYNVENTHLPGGGGEYPTQDGFGWSNGVYLKFYSMYK